MKMYLVVFAFCILTICFPTETDTAPPPMDDHKMCVDRVNVNKTYTDGDEWAEGACTVCICENGKRICAEKSCMFDCPVELQVIYIQIN